MSSRSRITIAPKTIASAALGFLLLGGIGQYWWNENWQAPETGRSGTDRAAAAVPARAAEKPLRRAGSLAVADVRQSESGRGLVVCDPRTEASAAGWSQFAIGCSVWLQLHAAGQAELGRTPRHLSIRRAQAELQKDLLDLTPPEVVRFGRITGATHVALGRVAGIPGDPKRCRLTYQLSSTSDGKPFGQPYVLSGTEAEIVRGLPAAAQALAASLGVRKPEVPAQIAETAEEIRWFGACPWPIGRALRAEETTRLEGMRARSALALLYLAMPDYPDHELDTRRQYLGQVCADLAERAPWNTIAVSEAVTTLDEKHTDPVTARAEPKIRALLAVNPNNYLLRNALPYLALYRTSDRAAAEEDAFQAVCASVGNPDAWFALAGVIDYQALELKRQMEYAGSNPELLALQSRVRARSLPFWKRVVELDPAHAYGWTSLASAAAYMGDRATAERALQKACSFPYSRYEGYTRAFELFGTEFFNDESARKRYAQQMARDDWKVPAYRQDVARALYRAGYPELAEQALQSADERQAFQRLVESGSLGAAGPTE